MTLKATRHIISTLASLKTTRALFHLSLSKQAKSLQCSGAFGRCRLPSVHALQNRLDGNRALSGAMAGSQSCSP